MLKGLPVVAMVPARAGSKGIPNKNRIQIDGQSLALRALSTAALVAEVDAAFLTTDSDELIDEARIHGFLVRKRPARLALDTSLATEVISDCISYVEETLNLEDFYVLYLQPTSPLRETQHLISAINQLRESTTEALVSVKEATENPFNQFFVGGDKLTPVFPNEFSAKNRQDHQQTYLPNGAIYIFKASDFKATGAAIPFAGALPFIMESSESLDLDTPADLLRLKEIMGTRVTTV